MDELRVRTLRLAMGACLLSIVRDGEMQAPGLAETLEQIPRRVDVLLNLDGATPAEVALAYSTMVFSSRVQQNARPLIVVTEEPLLASLVAGSQVEPHVLIEPKLEDALPRLVGTRWLSTFAEIGAYASTRP